MQRGFDASWLGGTFSKAVFMGNGLMAIVAGLAAQVPPACCCSPAHSSFLRLWALATVAAARDVLQRSMPSPARMLQTLVDTLSLGPVAPFDAAAVVMVVGGLVVLATWPENYGDASNKRTLPEQLAGAARAIYNGESLTAPSEAW